MAMLWPSACTSFPVSRSSNSAMVPTLYKVSHVPHPKVSTIYEEAMKASPKFKSISRSQVLSLIPGCVSAVGPSFCAHVQISLYHHCALTRYAPPSLIASRRPAPFAHKRSRPHPTCRTARLCQRCIVFPERYRTGPGHRPLWLRLRFRTTSPRQASFGLNGSS